MLGANPEKLEPPSSSRLGVFIEGKKENLEILKMNDQYTKQKHEIETKHKFVKQKRIGIHEHVEYVSFCLR